METVAVPWLALAALGSAVSAVIVALWAKLRDKDTKIEEWTLRCLNETKRAEGLDFEDNTQTRMKRDELLQNYVKSDPPPKKGR